VGLERRLVPRLCCSWIIGMRGFGDYVRAWCVGRRRLLEASGDYGVVGPVHVMKTVVSAVRRCRECDRGEEG